jgi:hypothetical protein
MNNYKNRYSENPEVLKRDLEKLFLLSQYIPTEVNIILKKLDCFI